MRRAALFACLLLAGCSGDIGTPSEPLRILAPSLPEAVLNEAYNETIIATGGLRPYTFTLEDGALPPGIALQGGTLRGTPTELGVFEFGVSVSDANLSNTFTSFTLRVIEIPPPALSFEPPLTDIQGVTTLRGRVVDARALRALRTVVEFDADRFSLAPDSLVAARGDIALLSRIEPGRLHIDIAFLGNAFDGSSELFRFDLVPIEPTPLFVSSESEFLFANRHHFERLEEGRRLEEEEPADTDPADPALPDEDPNEGANQ